MSFPWGSGRVGFSEFKPGVFVAAQPPVGEPDGLPQGQKGSDNFSLPLEKFPGAIVQ